MSLVDEAYRLDSVLWAEEALDFHPDSWQRQVMQSEARRVLLCCSRQSGKSTLSAIMALHTALYEPGSLILLVSPSLRQSLELFGKVTAMMDELDHMPALLVDNKLSCRFEGGSRIVALPGHEQTIRGFSAPRLVIEDEAARCEDEIYRAITPMLAVSNGRLVLMSTPAGRRGHFYQEWTSGGPGWLRISITADQCPRISPEFLQEEKASLGSWIFRQEYLCEFVQDQSSMFSADVIDRMFTDDVSPLFPEEAI